MTVLPEGEPIFSEDATVITVADEAAGEYLEVGQSRDEAKPGTIVLDPIEWITLRDAIDKMFAEIRKHEKTEEPK